jgi:large subunit ribosomal protein L7/L12
MSEKIDQIVEELKMLTLLEASELVSKIEETFGVDASASTSGGTMVMAAGAISEEVEEKTEFNVMLDEVPADKKNCNIKSCSKFNWIGIKRSKRISRICP